ncbi:hypothetical protein EVB91_051 [Rhizobium phage RHph_I1_18]|nr:hypothetical protein EVB91_051 [Rhizobium phage RHph_I1_18]
MSKRQQPVTVRWENRKRLAVRAFYALLVYTLLYWFMLPWFFTYVGVAALWLTAIQDSYTWFAFTMMGVILGYMGFTTLPFIGKGRVQLGNSSPEEYEDPNVNYNKYQGDTSESYVDPNYKFNDKDM